jgi:hypothetical protein
MSLLPRCRPPTADPCFQTSKKAAIAMQPVCVAALRSCFFSARILSSTEPGARALKTKDLPPQTDPICGIELVRPNTQKKPAQIAPGMDTKFVKVIYERKHLHNCAGRKVICLASGQQTDRAKSLSRVRNAEGRRSTSIESQLCRRRWRVFNEVCRIVYEFQSQLSL